MQCISVPIMPSGNQQQRLPSDLTYKDLHRDFDSLAARPRRDEEFGEPSVFSQLSAHGNDHQELPDDLTYKDLGRDYSSVIARGRRQTSGRHQQDRDGFEMNLGTTTLLDNDGFLVQAMPVPTVSAREVSLSTASTPAAPPHQPSTTTPTPLPSSTTTTTQADELKTISTYPPAPRELSCMERNKWILFAIFALLLMCGTAAFVLSTALGGDKDVSDQQAPNNEDQRGSNSNDSFVEGPSTLAPATPSSLPATPSVGQPGGSTTSTQATISQPAVTTSTQASPRQPGITTTKPTATPSTAPTPATVFLTPAPTTRPTPAPTLAPVTAPITRRPTLAPIPAPTRPPTTTPAPAPAPVPQASNCFSRREQLTTAVDLYMENPDGTATSEYGHPIGTWCVSGVDDFSDVFSTVRSPRMTSFNEDISGWDVSGARGFRDLFRGAASFNQDLSRWNVGQSTDFRSMFQGACTFPCCTGLNEIV